MWRGVIDAPDRLEFCRVAGIRESVLAQQSHQVDIGADLRWLPDRLIAGAQQAVRQVTIDGNRLNRWRQGWQAGGRGRGASRQAHR